MPVERPDVSSLTTCSTGTSEGEEPLWGRVGAIDIEPSGSWQTLCEAFRLAHDHRVRAGRILPQPCRMHFAVHQLFPSFSRAWLARACGSPVGSAHVVLWSPAGLPSSPAFGAAFAGLRREGRRVAEGSFHVPHDFGPLRVRNIMRKLAVSAVRWAASRDVDDFCVSTGRNDLPFWSSKFGFEVLAVGEEPGEEAEVLLRLDLQELRAGREGPKPWLARIGLDVPGDLEPGEKVYKPSEEEVARLLLSRPDLCLALTVPEKAMLRYSFPNALWLAERCHLFSVRTACPDGGHAWSL